MSLEVIGELARHAADLPLFILADYRADEFPSDSIHREWRSRLLEPAPRRGGPPPPLTLEETGARDDADPRRRAAGAARRRRGRPRADERHPAPHRGAARRRSTTRPAPTAGGSATPTSRTRSATPSSPAWRACPTTPGRSLAPAPSWAAASAPTSSPAWSTARSRSSSRRSRSSSTPRSSSRSTTSTRATTTSATSSSATRSTTPCRRRQRRRYHAQAAEFVMALEGAERHPRLAPLRAGRSHGRGLPGGADRRRGSQPDLRAPRGIRALPAGDREHAAPTADRGAGRPVSTVSPRRRRDRAQRGVPPRPLPVRASCTSRPGRPIEAADMLMLTGRPTARARPADGGVRRLHGSRRSPSWSRRSPSTETRPTDARLPPRAAAQISCCASDHARRASERSRRRALAERVGDRETMLECDILLRPGSTSSRAATRPGSRTGCGRPARRATPASRRSA